MWWLLIQAKYVTANMNSLEQSKKKAPKPWHPWNTHPCFLIPPASTQQNMYFHGHGLPRWHINCCEQTLLIHGRISSRIFMSCSLQCSAEAPVTIFKATQPSFAGGGENFKGCHRKWKGTLFIRPECKTYQGSASALNQPGLRDML